MGIAQCRHDFVVGQLAEVVVELTDTHEALRRLHGDQLVGHSGQALGPVSRRHRNRQHHAGGSLGPSDCTGGRRRRTGGDPVIDDHHDPTRQRHPGRAARSTELRRWSSTRSAASTRAMSRSDTLALAITSSFRTRTPPSPSAPIASSGWNGTASLRTMITSSSAPSASATSAPTARHPGATRPPPGSDRPGARVEPPSGGRRGHDQRTHPDSTTSRDDAYGSYDTCCAA